MFEVCFRRQEWFTGVLGFAGVLREEGVDDVERVEGGGVEVATRGVLRYGQTTLDRGRRWVCVGLTDGWGVTGGLASVDAAMMGAWSGKTTAR